MVFGQVLASDAAEEIKRDFLVGWASTRESPLHAPHFDSEGVFPSASRIYNVFCKIFSWISHCCVRDFPGIIKCTVSTTRRCCV